MDQDERYLDLLANIKALDMVVRGLFTRWAMEAPDPQESAFRMIEGMIGSLHAITEDATPEQVAVVSRIEDHLRAFGKNVDVRLRP
ncbi:hypothetical protein ABID58_006354 [Bradyrhizobium sp. S3.2.6]|uniref:hypothetical protein n=1 Tax=Bradyrhizobium sp. S3.2.6 TaxID=3156428 RepID=UPI003391A180